MDELINPFTVQNFSTRVKLEPKDMNDELYLNLKNNVRKKVEGKCNSHGFIQKVVKITEYEDNYINDENFSGDAEFNVKYDCIIGIVVPGNFVVCKVVDLTSEIEDNFIVLKNGVIRFIVDDVSGSDFLYFDNKKNIYRYKSDNSVLEKGDYIVVKVIFTEFTIGETDTIVSCEPVRKAKKSEIEKFYNEYKEENNIFDFLNIVETNEDVEENIDSKNISEI